MLVGKQVPVFRATAVINGEIVSDFSLQDYIDKSYVLLFFYPKDFTFVCPTELLGFQAALPEFEKRNTVIVGCSTDTEYSHWAWCEKEQSQGGIKGVTYPLIADTNKTIADAFDVLAGERYVDEKGKLQVKGELVAYRGLFLIDKQGIVRHQLVNDMPLGRSIDEAIRIVDALQHYEQYGEVCPLGWHPGEDAMAPTQEGVAEYLRKVQL